MRVVRAKTVLSRALLASGQEHDAERLARQAVEEARTEANRGERSSAADALAAVMLETGREEEALRLMRAIGQKRSHPKEWETINVAIYDLTLTRAEAAQGNHDKAADLAASLRTYFEDRGADALVLEADYVLLELERQRTGHLDGDRAEVLRSAARDLGLTLLSRRVSALARS